MFKYNIKLALKSMRRNPMMTALMVAAIAVGIGVSMTTLSVFYMMSSNPIPEKSDVLFGITLDSWDPLRPFSENKPERAPHQLTFQDAERLLAFGEGKRQTAMFETSLIIEPEGEDELPFEAGARVTHGDFFAMFQVPFIFGSGWDANADTAAEQVVVLTRKLNDRIFGGENSVGNWLTMHGTRFQVVGVIDYWEPTPRFFDPINGAFQETNEMFIPFSLERPLELPPGGSDWGWKSETISSHEQWLASEACWIQYFVELEGSGEREEYLAHLNAYVEGQKALGRFARPMNNNIFDVEEWLEYHEVVARDSQVLVGLSFLFLLVCIISTIALTLTKFVGKKAETSLRRALGASRSTIFKQQIVEVGLIGLSGGLIGLLLVGLGLQGIEYLYDSPDGLVRLDGLMIFAAVAVAIFSSVIAGLYPAWRVCSIPPASQLKTQ